MRVQTRILLVLGGAFLAGVIALALILKAIVAPAFEELDLRQAKKDVARVQQGIANELANLGQKAIDWGHWDDTYTFVVDRDASYIEGNLQPSSLINLAVDFMAFYDAAAQPVWTGGFDRETEDPVSLPGLNDARQVGLTTGNPSGQVQGLALLDGQPYLVAVGDILDSDGVGPVHGTIAIGRALNERLLKELRTRTEVDFRIEAHRSTTTSPNLDPTLPRRDSDTEQVLRHRYTLVDLKGVPQLDVVVDTPKGATRLGHQAINVSGALSISVMVLVLVMIALVVTYTVVRPIQAINSAMTSVGSSTELEQRLGWTRTDELGQLATQFDRMLDQISEARRKLLESTFQTGRQDLAAGMLHNIRNALSPLANQLRRAGAAAAPDENLLERALEELKTPDLDTDRRLKLIQYIDKCCRKQAEDRRSAGQEIGAASAQLSAIEQILNQQQSANKRLDDEELRLQALVRESISLFSPTDLAAARIEVDESVSHVPPIIAPRLPMIHVVYNLIDNAVGAIESGGRSPGVIKIRAAQLDGRFVRVEVSDDGIGVGEEALSQLFRSGYTTKLDGKGGEGLHWCANVVNATGGKIGATSGGLGRGLTVTMDLPIARAEKIVPETRAEHHDA